MGGKILDYPSRRVFLEGKAEGKAEGKLTGRNITFYELVSDGIIQPEIAAQKLQISVKQLKANMINTGFPFPE